MTRIAVIDSSVLINLVHLDLALKLSLFFQVVHIPRTVHGEVNKKSRLRYRLRKLYRTGLFTKCLAVDRVRVQLLTELDPGEAEALVQAQEQGATVFLGDEKRARGIGENMGLKPVGTARILARLHWEDYCENAVNLVAKLRRELGYRVTDDVVQEAITKAPEPI